MGQEWFVAKGSEKLGPFSAKDLKHLADNGRLQPADLVQTAGMTTWKEARKIKGLFPEGATKDVPPVPPPLPSEVPPPLAPPLPSATSPPSSATFEKARAFIVSLCQLLLFAAAFSGVGGAFCDFGTPVAPFNLIFCAGTAAIMLLFLLMFLALRRQGLGLASLCLFSVSVGFGAWWLAAQYKGSQTRGYLAKHVKAISELQTSLLREHTRIAKEIEPQNEKRGLQAVEASVQPDENGSPRVITEDYLPTGSFKRTYADSLHLPNKQIVRCTIISISDKNGNVREQRTNHTVTDTDRTDFPSHKLDGPPGQTRYRRVRNGFVEVSAEGDKSTWFLKLKLGATIGDTWKAPGVVFKVEDICPYAGVATDYKGRRCVIIGLDMDGMHVTDTFVKGVGETEHIAFVNDRLAAFRELTKMEALDK